MLVWIFFICETFAFWKSLVDLSIVSSGDKSNQQENIFGSEINLEEIWKLPDVDDWNYKEKLEKERTSLGFYYSGHPLDCSKKFLDQLNIIDISLINESSETIVNTVGVVMQVIERSSKNGRFARLIISGISSLEEVIIYSDIYFEKKSLLKLGTELYLKIAVTKDNNGTSRLLVRDLWPLEAKLNELTLSLEISFFVNL